jgi:hypothetical protein
MGGKDEYIEAAFPCDEYGERGMTLRDWFAGQALVAMGMWIPDGDHRRGEMVASRAVFAYLQADAMLAERKRRNDK